jgi:hypothetical protein
VRQSKRVFDSYAYIIGGEVFLMHILNEAYVVMTISCPHCKQEQVVQVRARTGFGVMSEQSITCVNCKRDFPAMLPDKIVGGPYLP